MRFLAALLIGALGMTFSLAAPVRTLPRGVKAALDQEYGPWRFAALSAEYRTLPGPEGSAEWLQGDYDADGRPDVVAQIVHSVSSVPTQSLVVLLRRDKGFERHVLESGPVSDDTYLLAVRKGEEVMDFEADRKLMSPTEAFTQVYDNKASVTYLYDKKQFRRIVSGD